MLYSTKKGEEKFQISPVLISEGSTSVREAVRAGLGIGLLPEWLIREDLLSGRLVRVLPERERIFSRRCLSGTSCIASSGTCVH